jgi:hypothetical protein
MKTVPLSIAIPLFLSAVSLSGQRALAASVASIGYAPKAASASKPNSRSWVRLKAATDQARYSPGQPITVRFTATNTARHGALLRFSSGQRFDFSVRPIGQKAVAYTWSATRMFMQSTGSLWLKPGQSHTYEAAIGDEMGQLKPGKYHLLAHLTNSTPPIRAAPITFEVVDLALSMTARTDKARYKIGEPVQISVAVPNRAGRANRVNFGSGLACDVLISDEAGRPVWTYGANLRFIRALGPVTWRKGEAKTYSATWNGVALPGSAPSTSLQPGRYQVQAVLQSTPPLYARPVFIDIQE